MVAIYTPSFFQPQNINGVPLAGAKLYFYTTGTTTPITVYQDDELTTPHANPVVADASGIFAPIYTALARFKTVLKTSADVTVQTVDPVFAASIPASSTTNKAVARWDANGGLQNSAVLIEDSGAIQAIAGSAAAPAIYFGPSLLTTGIFGSAAGIGVSISGTQQVNFGLNGYVISNDTTGIIDVAAAEYGFAVDYSTGVATVAAIGQTPLRVKRDADGVLLNWYSGVTNVGSVSVAAGTVTYGAFCGAHWSQWAGEAPAEILRGTVLEAVDEMCEWPGEVNTSLPKVKVSDTAVSPRVYGVYSHPDSEDPDRDFHVASLGAHQVRIGAGVVVKNGDYLESAGNGCARVQKGGFLRNSTVGKVISAHAVETYTDGSYLVPCTLHCG